MPKGYVIAHADVTDPEKWGAVRRQVEDRARQVRRQAASCAAASARSSRATASPRNVVLEFPSYETALGYANIARVRRGQGAAPGRRHDRHHHRRGRLSALLKALLRHSQSESARTVSNARLASRQRVPCGRLTARGRARGRLPARSGWQLRCCCEPAHLGDARRLRVGPAAPALAAARSLTKSRPAIPPTRRAEPAVMQRARELAVPCRTFPRATAARPGGRPCSRCSRRCFPDRSACRSPGRRLTAGLWSLDTVPIRDFGIGRHRAVDDTPAGGGAGMVMRADVLAAAIDQRARDNARMRR